MNENSRDQMMIVLTKLFAHEIDGQEPRIVELEQPIRIVGLAIETDVKRIPRDVPRVSRRLEKIKPQSGIAGRKDAWAFAAVSKDFDEETGAFMYIIGDVVAGHDPSQVPAGLLAFEIPAITYAVFPVRPKNRFGWGVAIADVKRYAYRVWLPDSEYGPTGILDDFEYHDERSTRRRNPEIDLYVAVRDR